MKPREATVRDTLVRKELLDSTIHVVVPLVVETGLVPDWLAQTVE